MASLLSTMRKEAKDKLKQELLSAYRWLADGNTHAPDGTNLRVYIDQLERKIKEAP
jgi:hypothetical protein